MKGSLQDILFIFTMLFSTMLAVAILWPIYSQFSAGFRQIGGNTTQIEDLDTHVDSAVSILDIGMPVISIFVFLASVAAASQVRSHPVFFIFMLIVNVMAILLIQVYEDAWEQVNTTGKGKLVWTPLFLEWGPKISVVMMVFMAAIVFLRGAVS